MRRGMGGGQGLGATKGATEYMQQERGGDESPCRLLRRGGAPSSPAAWSPESRGRWGAVVRGLRTHRARAKTSGSRDARCAGREAARWRRLVPLRMHGGGE